MEQLVDYSLRAGHKRASFFHADHLPLFDQRPPDLEEILYVRGFAVVKDPHVNHIRQEPRVRNPTRIDAKFPTRAVAECGLYEGHSVENGSVGQIGSQRKDPAKLTLVVPEISHERILGEHLARLHRTICQCVDSLQDRLLLKHELSGYANPRERELTAMRLRLHIVRHLGKTRLDASKGETEFVELASRSGCRLNRALLRLRERPRLQAPQRTDRRLRGGRLLRDRPVEVFQRTLTELRDEVALETRKVARDIVERSTRQDDDLDFSPKELLVFIEQALQGIRLAHCARAHRGVVTALPAFTVALADRDQDVVGIVNELRAEPVPVNLWVVSVKLIQLGV